MYMYVTLTLQEKTKLTIKALGISQAVENKK